MQILSMEVPCPVRKLRSREKSHTHWNIPTQLRLNLESSFSFHDPLSPPHPPFFFSFSGYTYKLPRVLDNTSIFQLFSSSHDFPMKILLFPLSDVTRGPQAGLINWSLWHLKRQSSPGRRMACDCSVPSYCIPTSPASPSRAKRQAIGNSCWGKDFCM